MQEIHWNDNKMHEKSSPENGVLISVVNCSDDELKQCLGMFGYAMNYEI